MRQVADAIVHRLRAAGCVFAEDEAALLLAEFSDPDQLENAVSRRADGEPLEYVLGWAEFAEGDNCMRIVRAFDLEFVPPMVAQGAQQLGWIGRKDAGVGRGFHWIVATERGFLFTSALRVGQGRQRNSPLPT